MVVTIVASFTTDDVEVAVNGLTSILNMENAPKAIQVSIWESDSSEGEPTSTFTIHKQTH